MLATPVGPIAEVPNLFVHSFFHATCVRIGLGPTCVATDAFVRPAAPYRSEGSGPEPGAHRNADSIAGCFHCASRNRGRMRPRLLKIASVGSCAGLPSNLTPEAIP